MWEGGKVLEVVEQSWRLGRGRGVRTEAVREGLGRREGREEVIESSDMVEREAMAGGWRQLMAQLLVGLVRLVRLEPRLGERGLSEDQSLVTGGGRLEEDWREMFCSGKS